jgi:hypothetical protein
MARKVESRRDKRRRENEGERKKNRRRIDIHFSINCQKIYLTIIYNEC